MSAWAATCRSASGATSLWPGSACGAGSSQLSVQGETGGTLCLEESLASLVVRRAVVIALRWCSLLALEVSRPEGPMEDSFELQSSAVIAGVFRCGLIRGECMREFHPALSATTNVVPLSVPLCLSLSSLQGVQMIIE